VAKILVADDNSNVQKTVSLALADLSVEVASVNNGEAAVRKLADIAPDLILADIFMPVRNGYEVCEFVKKDPRFAHVPVVLLVGAFDPLDEREAQRVGADGILKKPFVPPDPLIAMVKTLLDRSLGDRLVPVGAAKPAAAQQGKSGGVAVDERPPAPPVPSAPLESHTPERAEEMPVEEFAPPEPISFGEGERPIAFGQLLETPAEDSAAPAPETMEPVDDTQVLTSSRDASLGEPIFWKTEEPEPESEEENAESDEEFSSDAPMRPWSPEGQAASDARAKVEVVQPVQPVQPVEPVEPVEPAESFELVREEQESAQASSVVESSSLIAQDAASQASLTVQSGKAEGLAANPIEWMASVPPPAEEIPAEETPTEAAADWSATASDPEDTVDSIEPEIHRSAEEAVASVPPAAAAPSAGSPSPISLPSLSPQTASSDQPQAARAPEPPNPNKTHPSLNPLDQSVEDTARSIPKQEWADLAATLLQRPGEAVADKSRAAAPPAANSQPAPASLTETIAAGSSNEQASSTTNSALPPTPDPALVEAVVQRVLDKMRPQVVDIITKEFLRPVVQALVHREINKR
jgi:CheY-like chemotaxis protein